MTNRSEKEMLVCGFETRKVKGKDHWVGLLHLLDENLQKWTKIIDSGFASSDLSHHASEIPLGTEVKVNERNLKPYRGGWRSQFSGVGTVRGMGVFFSEEYRTHPVLFIQVDIPGVGVRNIEVISTPDYEHIAAEEVKEIWEDTYSQYLLSFPMGSPVGVEWKEYGKRKGYHVLTDPPTHVFDVDRGVHTELPASPAG